MEEGDRPIVLILEDEEINLVLLKRILEKGHCHVLAAANGNQAVLLARENHPDLAILDINLPGENGIAVLSRLRNEADFHGPAYAATGIIDESELGMLEGTGLAGYIGKPYDPERVLGIVQLTMLNKSKE